MNLFYRIARKIEDLDQLIFPIAITLSLFGSLVAFYFLLLAELTKPL